MAFLSLGLNIEEPKPTEAQNAPGDFSNEILSDKHPVLVPIKEAQEETQVSPDKAPHNGSNGNPPRTAHEPIEAEPEKENWPEMGMQIIQSVLRQAQNKEAG